MAETKLKPENEIDKQVDERLAHPNLQNIEQETGKDAGTNAGTDRAEAYANDSANATDAREKIQNQEENPLNYQQKSIENNPQPQKATLMGNLRKRGPLSAITIGLLMAGFGFGALTPALAIVHFKETLAGDLNDQLGSMSLRSDRMLRAKLKGLSSGVCAGKVSIRCKFSTMTDRQVKRFEKAGIKVEPNEADKSFGRRKPTSFTFTNPDGTTTKVTSPDELKKHLTSSPAARSAIRKAFNPKFVGLSDKVSRGVFSRFHTGKESKIKGTSEKDMNQSVDSATAGEKVTGLSVDGTSTDENGKTYTIDEHGDRVYREGDAPAGAKTVSEAKFNELREHQVELNSRINVKREASTPKTKAVGGVLKSGFKGLSLAGTADTACTVYNTARAVSAAAKLNRAIQLAQFAMIFLNVADKIKAGTATPEEVSYLGNKLTAIDTTDTVEDESSTGSIARDKDGKITNVNVQGQANPYKGKNAFDSPGFQTAAYNDAPNLRTRDIQYMIGGGLSGKMSNVMDKILATLHTDRNGVRGVCSKVQSWWARTAGLIAGLVSAIGSFGASTAISISASVAIGFAMPFLEASLADIMAGTVVSSATDGVDAGDAAFSGSGALLGGMAMGHGMRPAKTTDELKQYIAVNDSVKSDYIATETYEAQSTPFDIYNPRSFLGSITYMMTPSLIQSNSSFSSAISHVPSVFGALFTGALPKANAVEGFNNERFSKCNDPGYQDIGIEAADIFCNVRYVMDPTQLDMDEDQVASWMISSGHIEEDGTPKSDEFKKWIENCVNRTDGWGETSNDDDNGDWANGKECLREDVDGKKRNQYFGTFYMDSSISDSMDDDSSSSTPSQDTGGLPIVSGSTVDLAKQLKTNPNVEWQGGQTSYWDDIIADGKMKGCGPEVPISSKLLSLLQSLSLKYKLVINNMVTGHPCDNFNHPKGLAVDINGINPLSGDGGTGSQSSPGMFKNPIVSQFYVDAANVMARNGVGGSILQNRCFAEVGASPPVNPAPDLVNFGLNDSCDHIHMSVKDIGWVNE